MNLHDFQQAAVADAVGWLKGAPRGAARLYAGPTGCGKSYVIAGIHESLPGNVCTFPSVEIAAGVYEKLYGEKPKSRAEMEGEGLWTIKRLLNEVRLGRVKPPSTMVDDEGHHSIDDTHGETRAILGNPPVVLVTATPYRGTAQETQKLLELVGYSVTHIITLKAAVARRIISVPTWDVWPLINDETIDVSAGEFVVKQVDGRVKDILPDLVDRLGQFWDTDTGLIDRPTMIAVSSVTQAGDVTDALNHAGLPALSVVGGTNARDRQTAFDSCLARRTIMVQIKVVGEGIDLPVRRLIDLAPTMSPVFWMQRVGRITRPVRRCVCRSGTQTVGDTWPCRACNNTGWEPNPEYIACCHNLSRHAYLWAGFVPALAIKKAQQAWGPDFKPTRRMLARAIGLEGLGRFVVTPVRMLDGTDALFYSLQTKDRSHEYAVFVHPADPDQTFYFHRENFPTDEIVEWVTPAGHKVEVRRKDWGKWHRIKGIPDLAGCISSKPTRLTDRQQQKWVEQAAYYGLDPDEKIDNRTFQLLPCLWDTRTRIKT